MIAAPSVEANLAVGIACELPGKCATELNAESLCEGSDDEMERQAVPGERRFYKSCQCRGA